MLVLGIDPGTATTGYGIIKKEGSCLKCLEYGVIATDKKMELAKRLEFIYKEVVGLLKKYRIDKVAIENLYFFNNQKTAFQVGQARGVVMLAVSEAKLPILEPTPLQVKQAVSGYGQAQKSQVQKMVKLILNLCELPKPDDAADALAVAIFALNNMELKIK